MALTCGALSSGVMHHVKRSRTLLAVLTRKQTAQRVEKDWLYFSSALASAVASDYVALRILYRLEPLTTAYAILVKSLDVAEKALKIFVMVSSKETKALSSAKHNFGHNIEKLLSQAARYCPVFAEPKLVAFAAALNDKAGRLYQHIRYGSEETTDGFEANLAEVLPIVDRIFVQSILNLPSPDRHLVFYVSPLKNLVTGSQLDQTADRQLVLDALRFQNAEMAAFEALCSDMDREHEQRSMQLNSQSPDTSRGA